MTKRCTKCDTVKPETEFHWQAGRKLRRNKCRACVAKYDRQRLVSMSDEKRAARNAKRAAWYRNCTPEQRKKRDDAAKRYKQRHPEKVAARWRADRAVPLEGMCEECGERPAEQRHHEDYSKPLEVKRLCNRCHGKTRLVETSSDRNPDV